jgi:hypothetical protein
VSAREQDVPREVAERVQKLHEDARGLILAMGRVWTPEERARVLWAAMNGKPTTVAITVSPAISISVWCDAELMAVIPCSSTAETMQ